MSSAAFVSPWVWGVMWASEFITGLVLQARALCSHRAALLKCSSRQGLQAAGFLNIMCRVVFLV